MLSGYSYTEFHKTEYFLPFIKERLQRNEAIEFTDVQ